MVFSVWDPKNDFNQILIDKKCDHLECYCMPESPSCAVKVAACPAKSRGGRFVCLFVCSEEEEE